MFLYAFDLIELNGDDLRRDPLVVRKATLASVLAKAAVGIRFNEHMEFDDGEVVFYHACKLGLEGIVSKRKDSTYRSGRSPDWLKMKNSALIHFLASPAGLTIGLTRGSIRFARRILRRRWIAGSEPGNDDVEEPARPG